jgi:hypothetical protein
MYLPRLFSPLEAILPSSPKGLLYASKIQLWGKSYIKKSGIKNLGELF